MKETLNSISTAAKEAIAAAADETQIEENDRLQEIVDSEDKSEYIEKIAREKLGFIMPGEKVFYDVTPGA